MPTIDHEPKLTLVRPHVRVSHAIATITMNARRRAPGTSGVQVAVGPVM